MNKFSVFSVFSQEVEKILHIVRQGIALQMSVDVFTVADFYNHNEQNLILDLINDTVIAGADAVKLFVGVK